MCIPKKAINDNPASETDDKPKYFIHTGLQYGDKKSPKFTVWTTYKADQKITYEKILKYCILFVVLTNKNARIAVTHTTNKRKHMFVS
jgi:hypothetical protein